MIDDRDWLGDPMTVVAVPVQTKLWTAIKDTGRAEMWARRHPLGHEVRCYFNDTFLWSVVVRPGVGSQLHEIADEHRNVWIGLGWAVTE